MLGGLGVADKSRDTYGSHSYYFIKKSLEIPDQ